MTKKVIFRYPSFPEITGSLETSSTCVHSKSEWAPKNRIKVENRMKGMYPVKLSATLRTGALHMEVVTHWITTKKSAHMDTPRK